jgi:hypothetical protein
MKELQLELKKSIKDENIFYNHMSIFSFLSLFQRSALLKCLQQLITTNELERSRMPAHASPSGRPLIYFSNPKIDLTKVTGR